jgi:hypothetical protein
MTCFYANLVSLCGDGIDYGRDGVDYVAALPRPEPFGLDGHFPGCLILSVQFWTDDGYRSPKVSAHRVCEAYQ